MMRGGAAVLGVLLFGCQEDEFDVCDDFTTAYCKPEQELSAEWLAPECLVEDVSPSQATYGLLFEQDQDLDYGIEGGGYLGAWGEDDGSADLSDGQRLDAVVEGAVGLCAESMGFAGWWIEFREAPDDDQSRLSRNFTAFERGSIEFELRTDVAVSLKLEWRDGEQTRSAEVVVDRYAVDSVHADNWESVSVPLCAFEGLDLAEVWSPFALFATDGDAGTYCVDAVRWVQALNCPSECDG